MFKIFLGILSFLTILPIERYSKSKNLEYISQHMYFFPLIGLFIGLLIIPPAVFSFYFFNSLLTGFLITIYLIIVTGAHHTDALADFSDGIMVKGNKEKKYEVIHDPRIGSAGIIGVTSYLIGMIITISSFTNLERLIYSILIAEIIAKYSMVFQAYTCISAWEGYSSLFTKNMKSKKKIIISTFITIILIILLHPATSLTGIKMLITGVIVSILIIYISNKNFGGITGDSMGATNEIVRLGCLISAL